MFFSKFLKNIKKKNGLNHKGQIIIRRRGGGHKRLLRFVDFSRNYLKIKNFSCYKILNIEYDPIRSSNISLICTNTNNLFYIITPENHKINQIVYSNDPKNISIGSDIQLKYIPIGSQIYNIELLPNTIGKLSRSAGAFSILLKKNTNFSLIKLNSGQHYILSNNCWATIGQVSNMNKRFIKKFKAGQNRWLGKRPSVRGVAMNPIDHPHGGGEGKTSGGRPSVSLWGKLTKGKKTVKKKNKFIKL